MQAPGGHAQASVGAWGEAHRKLGASSAARVSIARNLAPVRISVVGKAQVSFYQMHSKPWRVLSVDNTAAEILRCPRDDSYFHSFGWIEDSCALRKTVALLSMNGQPPVLSGNEVPQWATTREKACVAFCHIRIPSCVRRRRF